ncbi:hypothetical protein F511_42706 [Dorcoceras hygrometricum]|uniref:Uncharacterized protein n=1 Tax=Dorcoceras hygrometricum TaxID=472368 RepID=A0A2Z7A6J9_9LAMI|nr:hypothetical protein F511_42706 [Dorcoceras hygrometricum]
MRKRKDRWVSAPDCSPLRSHAPRSRSQLHLYIKNNLSEQVWVSNFELICLEKLSGWYKSLEQTWRVRVLARDLLRCNRWSSLSDRVQQS